MIMCFKFHTLCVGYPIEDKKIINAVNFIDEISEEPDFF